MNAVLEISHLTKRFDALTAVDDLSLKVLNRRGWRLVSVVDYVFWFERHLTPLAPDGGTVPAQGDLFTPEDVPSEGKLPAPTPRR